MMKYGWRNTTEETKKIDIRWLRNRGYLCGYIDAVIKLEFWGETEWKC